MNLLEACAENVTDPYLKQALHTAIARGDVVTQLPRGSVAESDIVSGHRVVRLEWENPFAKNASETPFGIESTFPGSVPVDEAVRAARRRMAERIAGEFMQHMTLEWRLK